MFLLLFPPAPPLGEEDLVLEEKLTEVGGEIVRETSAEAAEWAHDDH